MQLYFNNFAMAFFLYVTNDKEIKQAFMISEAAGSMSKPLNKIQSHMIIATESHWDH